MQLPLLDDASSSQAVARLEPLSTQTPASQRSVPRPEPALGRNALERLLKIHQRLSARAYPNTIELSKEFEVAQKTIRRDIQWMKDHWNIPIAYDYARHGFYYTKPVDKLPGIPTITEAELLAILVAHKALEQYQATPFYQPLQLAFLKFSGQLNSTERYSVHNFDHILSFRSFAPELTDLERFQAVTRGLLNHRKLRFEYRKPGEPKPALRCIHPYHLACVDNLWYIIGYDEARSDDRTFALCRICGPVFLGDKFEKPQNFNLETYLHGSLNILKGEADYRIVIEFDPWAADMVRTRKWHRSQQIQNFPGGACRLQLRLSALEEIERWILSWGTHATVIEPLALAQRLSSVALTLAKRYPPSQS